jgi:hypothetical protein
MSDYFGALMRSSGLAVGGAAPIVAPRVESAMPIAVDVEQPTARAQPAVSPAPTAVHDTNPASTPHAPPVHDERSAAPRATVESQTPVQAGAPLEAGSITSPAIEPAAPPAQQAPMPANALVRTAMQWVAAGPQELRAKPPEVVKPSNTPAHEEPASHRPDAIREQRPPARDESPGLHPRGEYQTAVPSQALPPLPARPLIPQPATLRAAPAPAPRDDTVEVSIGAIHVRVDAPATQTLARTPPAPRAASAPRTDRGALSRRALRRI